MATHRADLLLVWFQEDIQLEVLHLCLRAAHPHIEVVLVCHPLGLHDYWLV